MENGKLHSELLASLRLSLSTQAVAIRIMQMHAKTRFIFHFPYAIFHLTSGGSMTNDNCKMENGKLHSELLASLCLSLSTRAVAIRIMQMHLLLRRHLNVTKTPPDRRAVIGYHPLKLKQL